MKRRVALEYRGYLLEDAVAVDGEIDALDFSEQVEHFWSLGPTEPIISTGLGPKYRIIEIELPSWTDPIRYQNDIRYRQAVTDVKDLTETTALRLLQLPREQRKASAALCKVNQFRSSFLKSLHDQVDTWIRGESTYSYPLSPRQLAAVTKAYRIRY